ncbi:FHA domain-containing protein [Pseudomarimonas arenosa]|uniref:FHA domain-containing protein n=1 Tax=Pseudomarimonas arenosa TaxID=2774145 RepID=A0AAW3ZI07_9GAMM|nr:FHA domain-containing protein [Pseudomarimonas arenosa]MBD8524575.1 FHA domain-containing protein [Pseudomarimonas arenosa]
MRVCFPNGEHSEVMSAGGPVSIGSAVGNDVVLSVAGIESRHAVVRQDPQRGILLEAATAGAQMHVNGRAVSKVALVRLGDVLSLGRVQVILKPDRDEQIVVNVPSNGAEVMNDPVQRAASSRVVLRGVGGGFFGRSVALTDKVVLGSGSAASIAIEDPDLPEQAVSFEIHGDRVILRDLGTTDGAVVNGVSVRNAVLHPGDQIAVESHRFVLEAPGLPARGAESQTEWQPGSHAGSTQTMRAVGSGDVPPPAADLNASDAEARQAGGSRLGWLLLAAGLIGAALAALLWFNPGA